MHHPHHDRLSDEDAGPLLHHRLALPAAAWALALAFACVAALFDGPNEADTHAAVPAPTTLAQAPGH